MKMTMDPECDYLSFMVTSKERVQKDGVWCELLWLQRCRHLNSTRTFPLLSSRAGQWVPTRTGRRGRQAPGQLRLKSSGLSFFPSTFRLHFLLWLQPPYFLLNPAQQKKKKRTKGPSSRNSQCKSIAFKGSDLTACPPLSQPQWPQKWDALDQPWTTNPALGWQMPVNWE